MDQKTAFGPDTPKAVTVVPMFAPMVTGRACSTRSSPAAPRGTNSDVVIGDDGTMTVITTPTKIDNIALEPRTFVT